MWHEFDKEFREMCYEVIFDKRITKSLVEFEKLLNNMTTENVLKAKDYTEIPTNYTGTAEFPNGSKGWYKNGLVHRDNGPAIECKDGIKHWAIFGKPFYTEESFNEEIKRINSENQKIEEQFFLKIKNFKDIPDDYTGLAKSDEGNKFWFKNGRYHCLNGPAIEYSNGKYKNWYIEGKEYLEEDFHQKVKELAKNMFQLDNILKVKVLDDSIKNYTGIIETEDKTRYWFKNGLSHREDGPSIIYVNGSKEWFFNGKRHRLDGPAFEYATGEKYWFIDGKEYLEENYNKKVLELNLENSGGFLKVSSFDEVPINFTGLAKNSSGTKMWYVDGKPHRLYGPVIENSTEKEKINPVTFTGVVTDHEGMKGHFLNGNLHREDGPAIEYKTGTKEWWINGKRHRIDAPAIEHSNGTKEWFVNHQRHRENGPAIEGSDGINQWYLNDVRHRINEPAVEHPDGRKEWWHNGELHREGAPAIEHGNGKKEWYQYGKRHRLDGPAFEDPKTYDCWFIEGIRLGTGRSKEKFDKKIQEMTDQEKKTLKIKNLDKMHEMLEALKNYTGVIEVIDEKVKFWYKDGLLHRENGPAREWENGPKEWFFNNKCHRTDGPAIEWKEGRKQWLLEGKYHRLDGPAIEHSNGDKQWFIDDVEYSEEEFKLEVAKRQNINSMNSNTVNEIASTVSIKFDAAKSLVKSDLKQILKRVGAKKIIDIFSSFLSSKFSENSSSKKAWQSFFETENGKAFLGLIVGFSTEALKSKIPEKYQSISSDIGQEFRVEAMSHFVSQFSDSLMNGIGDLAKNELIEIFSEVQESEQIRIDVTNASNKVIDSQIDNSNDSEIVFEPSSLVRVS